MVKRRAMRRLRTMLRIAGRIHEGPVGPSSLETPRDARLLRMRGFQPASPAILFKAKNGRTFAYAVMTKSFTGTFGDKVQREL
ncbi:hypothetical protein CQ13_14125 [Bradyrhizobium retamae]|uniref:Uncharacterized protein n=1 Tax=Bradyrhizobium retamae TaxID=1300035 RepID=A0A0R3NJ95_9BRAD|nr:hypothetical protein CQ13_14125 [Bradyrhizobium retamae]